MKTEVEMINGVNVGIEYFDDMFFWQRFAN